MFSGISTERCGAQISAAIPPCASVIFPKEQIGGECPFKDAFPRACFWLQSSLSDTITVESVRGRFVSSLREHDRVDTAVERNEAPLLLPSVEPRVRLTFGETGGLQWERQSPRTSRSPAALCAFELLDDGVGPFHTGPTQRVIRGSR